MAPRLEYSARERFWLWALAGAGLIGANGAFIYGLMRPGTLADALSNPIALSFVVEALALMGVLAYLMTRWGVTRLSWPWFVVLSLVGSMAFALPIVLLWPGKSEASR
jgi:hypothetical protein